MGLKGGGGLKCNLAKHHRLLDVFYTVHSEERYEIQYRFHHKYAFKLYIICLARLEDN